jgi:hypothetical protein
MLISDLFPRVRVLITNPQSFIDVNYYDKNNVQKGNI